MSKPKKGSAQTFERGRTLSDELIAFRDRRTGRMRWVGSLEALHRPAQTDRNGDGDLPDMDLLIALKGRRN